MKGFVKWLDDAPVWLKLVFCIPLLDIIWAVYRIVKGIAYKKTLVLIIGILWIIPGAFFGWLIDLISIAIMRKPILAD
ncbi:MAG: hypothetical protein E7374_00715 [Clostridiales bacterium]|nr:hypothetical protein [Clostridiales bacterium]